jgi:peptidyl-prolyl cis-trans isomerase C
MFMLSTRPILAALTLVIALAALPVAVLAQTETPNAEDDPVVARVNGEEIRRSAVFEMAQTLPPQYQSQLAQVYPLLVQRLVDFKLAYAAGLAGGLADDQDVKDRMAVLERRVIREIWIERALAALATDEALQASYNDFVAANPPKTEQNARHILLKTEGEAREVISKLDDGGDFVELAKELSTGPSGPQGGDLGYFTDDQMVPEFSTAASALEPGQYTKDPIKTQFGWHVIKVEDRREVPSPGFEEVEGQLQQELARENLETVLGGLRDSAEIEITPAGASMIPAAAAQ